MQRTNQTMGEVVEMMMARNTELFDEMLDRNVDDYLKNKINIISEYLCLETQTILLFG